MGALSALMSIGLFNIQASQSIHPIYEITPPTFDEIKIKLDKNYYQGDYFTIKTYNNLEENTYIDKDQLKNSEINNFWLYLAEFRKGALL